MKSEGWARACIVLSGASVACGPRVIELSSDDAAGTSATQPHSPHTPFAAASALSVAELPLRDLASTRFTYIAAGEQRWCGIVASGAQLVCSEQGQVTEERRGPYQAVGISEEQGWQYRCALTQAGFLECDGQELNAPQGPFSRLAVGVTGACARGPLGTQCWVPQGLGGIGQAPNTSGALSVERQNLCWGELPFFKCSSADLRAWLPIAGHYLAAVATADGACAAIRPSPADLELVDVDASSVGLLSTAQIACFSASGAVSKALGLFDVFDVNADGEGCGHDSETGHLRCWGRFAGAEAAASSAPYSQIAVSRSQVCWLTTDGLVGCWSSPAG